MGHMRAELFQDIADDAADKLKHCNSLTSTDSTPRFPGDMALVNLKGQLKLFELLMRRAANACRINAIGQKDDDNDQCIVVSLTLMVSTGSLRHPQDEQPALNLPKRSARVDRSPLDVDSNGERIQEIDKLIAQLEVEPLLACKPKSNSARGSSARSTLQTATVKETKRRGSRRRAKR